MQAGRFEEAVTTLRHVADLQPNSPQAHDTMGHALLQAGRVKEAVASFQRAVELKPDSPQALTALAWVEATERDAPLNPEHAVRLASRAAELTGNRDAHVLDVLAAAYAVDGRLADAVRTSEAAETLAAAGTDPDLTAQIRARLSIYRRRSGQP
jgi:Flp pilus assembly protein TadD